ncbi:hypothetical protein AAVH_02241 [Aphelenchoides avenae]|nr:hypothetical protein AAVH_02241 [Aphelenchus avenae]
MNDNNGSSARKRPHRDDSSTSLSATDDDNRCDSDKSANESAATDGVAADGSGKGTVDFGDSSFGGTIVLGETSFETSSIEASAGGYEADDSGTMEGESAKTVLKQADALSGEQNEEGERRDPEDAEGDDDGNLEDLVPVRHSTPLPPSQHAQPSNEDEKPDGSGDPHQQPQAQDSGVHDSGEPTVQLPTLTNTDVSEDRAINRTIVIEDSSSEADAGASGGGQESDVTASDNSEPISDADLREDREEMLNGGPEDLRDFVDGDMAMLVRYEEDSTYVVSEESSESG